MNLRAMTKEKLQFELPVVFTVGPHVNHGGQDGNTSEAEDNDALTKYAVLLADSAEGDEGGQQHIESIVKGIIEGETRVLVSSMSKYLHFL
jgi:flotillin